MLAAQNLEAIELMEAVRRFAGPDAALPLKALSDAVERLDFAAAAISLRALREHLERA
jgi:hypothetical protein